MNLAIEYLIRTGIVKQELKFPCSLFIHHYQTEEKVVVTIDELEEGFQVRKWGIERATDELPPCDENIIKHWEELFESDFSVVPEFKLLEYQEEPYTGCTYIDPENLRAENEFQNSHTWYGNTQKHKKYRRQWLWDCFCHVHSEGGLKFNQERRTMTEIGRIWRKWAGFFDIDRNLGYTSPELSFYDAYQKKNGKYKKTTSVIIDIHELHSLEDNYDYFGHLNSDTTVQSPSQRRWVSSTPFYDQNGMYIGD